MSKRLFRSGESLLKLGASKLMEKYESQVKRVNARVSDVFRVLSDMRSMKLLMDAMNNPQTKQVFMSTLPEDKRAEYEKAQSKLAEVVKDLSFTRDTIACNTALGSIGVRVADRELNKTIKISSDKSPLGFDVWAQVKELSLNETALKLTLKADIPFVIKTMFSSKLEKLNQAIEQGAAILAQLPYGSLCQKLDDNGWNDKTLEA